MMEEAYEHLKPGQWVVGIDEETALVWIDKAWRVVGRKRVVLLPYGRDRVIFENGDRVDMLPPPSP